MAITRAVASSITQGLPKNKSVLSGNLPIYAGSYESIQTVTVGAGGQSTISFTSIPTTYKHLQLRFIGGNSQNTTGFLDLGIKINSDTTAGNYSTHQLMGDGATTYSGATASGGTANGILTRYGSVWSNSAVDSKFTAGVFDFLDYANTNKYKTIRGLIGTDANGSGRVALNSSLWLSTSAITSITLAVPSNNLVQYSSFALYGIN